MLRAVFAAAVVAGGCGSAWADIPASAYVQTGLIAQWDGIENAGAGTHQAGATTWKNLKQGSLDFSLPSGCTVGDDSVTIPKNTKLTTSTSVFPSETPDAHAGTYECYWATPAIPTSGSYGATVLFISDMSFLYRVDKDQFQGTALMKDGLFYRHNFSYTATEQRAFHTVSYATMGTTTADNAFYLDGESRPGTVSGSQSMTQTARTGLVHHDTADYPVIYKSARIYNRKLDEDEVKLNAAIDKVRFAGATEDEVGIRYDAETRKLEVRVRVTYDANRGTVTADGKQVESGFSAWHEVGDTVTLVATPADGWRFVGWDGVCGGLDPKQGTLTVPLGFARNLTAKFAQEGVILSLAYVQDGLILQYDGIENAGVGTHDANARIWKDLSGSGNDAALTAMGAFGEKGLVLSIVKDVQYAATTKNTVKPGGSIEMFFRPTAGGDNTAGTMWAGHPTFTTTPVSLGRIVINAKPVYFSFTSDTSGRWLNNVAYDTDYHVAYVNEGGSKMRAYANGVDTGVTSTSALAESKIAFGGFSDYERRMKGTIYAVRIYNRKLTEAEVIYNAAIDRMRFSAVPPDGYRWNERTEKVEVLVSVALKGAGGTVSFDGEGAVATQGEAAVKWVELGTTVTFAVVPTDGLPILKWTGGTPKQTGVNSYSVEVNSPSALTAFVGKRLCTWTGGAGDELWTTGGNWEPTGAPEEGDVVQLGTGTVTLTNSTPQLAAVEIASTLAMSNWTACVRATTVTVANGGKVTVAGLSTDQATNRVWIVCDDCTIAAGGSIDVDDLGFRGSKDTRAEVGGKASEVSGPGKGVGVNYGASHGGHGGYSVSKGLNKEKFQNVLPYDDPLKPLLPGSGGYPQAWGPGTAGGGAVYISAAKSVRVDGAIKASVTKTVGYRGTSGSGGAVLIECETFHGTGGTISADGGGSTSAISTIAGDGYGGAAGGGGMIAIKYDPAKQTEDMIANMTISASSGLYDTKKAFGDETVRFDAGLGTVYFPDNKLLKDTFGRGLSGALINCASYEHEGDLTFGKGYLRLASEGAKLKVNGNLTLTGKMTRLDIGGVTITNQCTVAGIWAGRQTNVLEVAGALAITDGGRLDLRAAETNELVSIGAYLKVGGRLSVATNSTLSCWSDQVNMGSPFIEADSFRLDEGGLVTGFMRGCGPGKGLGGGKSASGGSHGGKSGVGTWSSAAQRPYDDEYLPTMPGSGGGNGSWAAGGPGGGVVYISVAREATVNGTINVDGMPAVGSHTGGGGAGGAIQIRCRTFFGGETGVLTAKGCDGLSHKDVGGGSGGGGGRIAIWCGAPWGPDVSRFRIKPFTDVEAYPEFFSFAMTTNVTGGVGAGSGAAVPTDPKTIADPGTVRFVYVRDKPGMRVIVR